MSDQEVYNIWYARPPERWAAEPAWMSVSTLLAMEACPRRWSLSSADYPGIWGGGYPPKPSSAALVGQILHGALEIITKALNRAGCCSIHDELFVSVLQELGGYTKVIEAQLDRQIVKLNNNPRAKLNAEFIISKLRTQIPELRGRVQMFVSKLKLQGGAGDSPAKDKSAPVKREPLPAGSHAEVELRVESLRWRGFVDFLNLGSDQCEIVDFKTGEAKTEHEFQVRVYNLLWARDVVLNPKARQVDRLSLLYANGELPVRPLTPTEISDLEIDLEARTRTALNDIRRDPPPAYPSVQNCNFCPVRHMCDSYWTAVVQKQLRAQKLDDPATHSLSKSVDLEVLLTKRESLIDWHAQVTVSGELDTHTQLYIQFHNNILPILDRFEVGTRLRLIDVYYVPQSEEGNSLPFVITLTRMSEVFIVGSL
jgi:hypothetical protein